MVFGQSDPVRGFWHICMVNHWYSIVVSQLRLLINSGLYDRCVDIQIGAVGGVKERAMLEQYILHPFPKLHLSYFSHNVRMYEFPTLQLIENTTGDYVGFYFHTKGVTQPNNTMEAHWRTVLEDRVLGQWQLHYGNIVAGYDLSSVNFLGRPKYPDHFSGNFWWFKRAYINKLPPVSKLNRNNRYLAEQWVCMSRYKRFYSLPFVEPAQLPLIITDFSTQVNFQHHDQSVHHQF